MDEWHEVTSFKYVNPIRRTVTCPDGCVIEIAPAGVGDIYNWIVSADDIDFPAKAQEDAEKIATDLAHSHGLEVVGFEKPERYFPSHYGLSNKYGVTNPNFNWAEV